MKKVWSTPKVITLDVKETESRRRRVKNQPCRS